MLSGQKPKGGLKVRQHPKKGFYVDELRVVPVHSFAEIEARIEEVSATLSSSPFLLCAYTTDGQTDRQTDTHTHTHTHTHTDA